MRIGAIFCLVGGLITLVSTYLLAFYYISILSLDLYGWGVGLLLNIINSFETAISSGEIFAIVLEIVFIIFLLAGVFQLLGLKSRFFGLFGSIFAIGVGVYFILIATGALSLAPSIYSLAFASEQIGPLPLFVPIGNLGLGTITLLAGGALGFIGSFMERD